MNKWDERFLRLAEQVSSWSKDPSTQTGAVIVDKSIRVVSLGFNGFPTGISDDDRLNNRDEKYPIIIHAEINAQLFANRNLEGCTIYTYPFQPCARCASVLIQAGINRVVSPEYIPERWEGDCKRAASLLLEGGAELDLIPNDRFMGKGILRVKSITDWAEESHKIATDHGFNDDSFPQAIAFIHSEASEALEAHREHEFEFSMGSGGKPEGVGSELADIVIRVFDTALKFGINIEAEISDKQEYNKTRPYKHGKNY